MPLYVAYDGARAASLCWLQPDTNRVFSYLPNWEKFVLNRPLAIDFMVDRELRYEEVSTRRASQIIAEGKIGRMDGRKAGWLFASLEGVEQLDVEDVLGQAPTAVPRGRGRDAAYKAAEVDQAPAGEWVTYRTFDSADRIKANVCATDLRTGRIRAFADMPIDVRTFDSMDGDQIIVRVRRHIKTSNHDNAATAANTADANTDADREEAQ